MSLQKHGYPRPLILKNGCEVHLRPLNPAIDRQRLFDFFARIPEDDRWYLENEVSDQSVIQHYLLDFHPRRSLPVVALNEDGRIVGKVTLNLFPRPGARAHVGKVRVVVEPEHRNQRLGTYLLLDMVQLAMDLGLRVLVLELVRGVENKAIRAARRLDFFEQAIIPDFAKDRRGNSYDQVIMIKRLHSGYDDF